ncbi:MAG TPA: GxxExxY protein [Gemmatimonadaceae bacterium]|nr:GxxExxY protein [Gemmatimonadaceae bacterium]
MRTSSPDDDSVPKTASTAFNNEKAGKGPETARKKLLYSDVTQAILDAFFAVYDKLGYGFLENVYVGALILELRRRGHSIAREVLVPVFYDGIVVARYRMDLIVDDCVVVEVKSTESLNPHDHRQLLNYVRATPLEVGLLLHFGPKPKFYRVATPSSSDAP